MSAGRVHRLGEGWVNGLQGGFVDALQFDALADALIRALELLPSQREVLLLRQQGAFLVLLDAPENVENLGAGSSGRSGSRESCRSGDRTRTSSR